MNSLEWILNMLRHGQSGRERRRDPAYELTCPVCGFLCLGHGGVGCIDKPSMVAREEQR